MAKIEITDEMVARLRERIKFHCYAGPEYGGYVWTDLGLALDDTLNSPERGPVKGPNVATDEQVAAVKAELKRMRAGGLYTARQEARNLAQAVVNAPACKPHEHFWMIDSGWGRGSGDPRVGVRYSHCECGATRHETITEPSPAQRP